MLDSAGRLGSLAAALLGLWLLWARPPPEQLLTGKLDTVISSLLSYEANRPLAAAPRVAVGYGACRDLFVSGAFIMANQTFPEQPDHFLDVQSAEQLRKMYAYFFQAGAAAERFVSDAELFQGLVARGETEPGHRWGLGGNAPVMAARFALEGAAVLLGAKLTPGLAGWVPEGMQVAGGVLDSDDVHLIMEYKRGEEWGPARAPRANRFILHHDLNNPLLSSQEEFARAVPGFRPDLLVVGGLQMMDSFPFRTGERLARIRGVRDQMAAMGPEVKIHFEMASFVDGSLLEELAEHVIPQADSLGMNEQELPNLHSLLTRGEVSVISDSNPRIADVLDQMREVYSVLSVATGSNRPVTRIHLHTLAYQAILAASGSGWKNTGAAAVKASLTAHRHVCADTEVRPENSFLIMDESFSTSSKGGGRRVPFVDSRPLTCWEEAELGVELCVAPVLVCARAVQTAGGGDNISAAGLVVSL
jgi:ADP-dependent glucokinase